MLRPVLAALLTGAALFGASAAQAGTHWSVGINLPLPGVVVTGGNYNGGYYAPEPAPVYYAPAPVYYAPPPPPRYVERDVYYAPSPRVVYETSYRDRRWDGRGDHWHGDNRRDDHRDGGWDRGHGGRDGYGPSRGR